MNYLGHLYLSQNNHSLMMANLFGDFFKGSKYDFLPEIVKNGVILHRSIDDYIDNHIISRNLIRNLYTDLPKIAPVALDLYFDHLLAKNWSNYSNENLDEFVTSFFKYALNNQNQFIENYRYPDEFINLLRVISNHNWLTRYAKIEGLEFACNGLSKRINFRNNLNKAPAVFINNEDLITNAFHEFMAEAIQNFKLHQFNQINES